MTWAVGQDVGNPLRKLVLMILADEHRDTTDLCFPGLDRIAAIGEMSTKSAARHIDALADLGLITVYRRGRSHGYTLHCPAKEDTVSGDGSQRTPAKADSVSMTPDSLSATSDSVSRKLDRESPEPGRTDSNRGGTGERARKRATRLPDDWQPSQADFDFVLKEGLDHGHIQRAADRFRDYWIAQPDPKGRKLDWSATWRNWVRKDAEDLRNGGQGYRSASGNQVGSRRTQREIQQDMAQAAAAVVHRRRLRSTEGAECTANVLSGRYTSRCRLH